MALDGRKNMPTFPSKGESNVCNHTGRRLQAAAAAPSKVIITLPSAVVQKWGK
mgnify:CR=1 FL=1